MRIRDKIKLDKAGLEKEGPITIVALGDSVTHGVLGPGDINYETVYWNRLKQKLNAYRNFMPINVIDAGVNGTTAKASIARLEKQVLKHEPDLVTICFGLNDVNGTLEDYIGSLRVIFERCLEAGAETVFMTPNMLNTYVHEMTPHAYYEYAAKTAGYQNSGRMDRYIGAAVALAEEMGVTVVDCYAKWKELSRTEDITAMLVNYLNHPTAAMHGLFADMLYSAVMGES